VATYPDRPYLKWSFKYEYPEKLLVKRDNPKCYLEGCRALHQMFTRFGKNNPDMANGDGVSFSAIKKAVAEIIAFPGKKEERISKWRSAARNAMLGGAFQIPSYEPHKWLADAARNKNRDDSKTALNFDLYRFYQAASTHRQYVLRELLPGHQLVVA